MCVGADMEEQREERIELGVALAASREKAHKASSWLAEAEESLSKARAGEEHVRNNVEKKLLEAKGRIEKAMVEVKERHEEEMGRVESRVGKTQGVLERARENYERELAAREAEAAALDGDWNRQILTPLKI